MIKLKGDSVKRFQDMQVARLNLYVFLHCLFSEPLTEQVFISLKDYGYTEEIEELNEGGKMLANFFNKAGEAQLQAEQNEFKRLFIGPESLPAPPWESFYTTKEQILFGETMYRVREKYSLAGLEYARKNSEPEDHIAVELEFMAWLIEKGPETFPEQLTFFEEHLYRWVPLFTEKLCASTASLLYKGAALMLKDFIRFETDTLKDMKERLEHV
ncbi:molecular chaperone [Mesobacillus zeae]|uniref:Dehydrogenase n=1 Tax=Mesobacillus zeae TaxID=1917180 RepID=A0A398B7N6_9BACI|nr:molecular chaperone TorD family protein [Mesobacillus zeae]RID85541.1 hypothetical protein D1970_08180 [Mesobacillus zeae]